MANRRIKQIAGNNSIQIGEAKNITILQTGERKKSSPVENFIFVDFIVPSPYLKNVYDENIITSLTEWNIIKDQITQYWPQKGISARRLTPPSFQGMVANLSSSCDILYVRCTSVSDGIMLESELGDTEIVTIDSLSDIFKAKKIKLLILDSNQNDFIEELIKKSGISAIIYTGGKLNQRQLSIFLSTFFPLIFSKKRVSSAIKSFASKSDFLGLRHFGDWDFGKKKICKNDSLLDSGNPPLYGLEISNTEGFVGRKDEYKIISNWINNPVKSLIGITGLGGIGKSTLASVIVMKHSWKFEVVISLSARDNPNLSIDQLAVLLNQAFKLKWELSSTFSLNEKINQIVSILNNRRVLLVLDNFEDISLDQSRDWYELLKLVDIYRSTIVIITLRPSVKLPITDLLVDNHLHLDPLSQIDAFQLLANGLTRKKLWHKVPTSEAKGVSENHFSLTVSTDKVSALEEMINLVAGHPLIIKLMIGDLGYPHVTWQKSLESLKYLTGRNWENNFEEILEKMLDELKIMDPLAPILIEALSIFQNGANYDALKAVGMPDRSDMDFDKSLRSCIDSSLLEFNALSVRYYLHPLVHSFVRKRVGIGNSSLETVYMNYFHDWLSRNYKNYDMLDRELPNLTKAFHQICQSENDTTEIFTLWDNWYFILNGHWAVYDEWSHYAIEAARRLNDSFTEARILVDWGALKTEQYQLDIAKEKLQRAQALFDALPGILDKDRYAKSILFQGYVEFRSGNFESAKSFADTVIVYTQLNNLTGVRIPALNLTAQIFTKQENFSDALDIYNSIEDQIRVDPVMEAYLANVLMLRGTLKYKMKQYNSAEKDLLRSVTIARKRNLLHLIASNKLRLAAIYYETHKTREALLLVVDSQEIFIQLGNSHDARLAQMLQKRIETDNV